MIMISQWLVRFRKMREEVKRKWEIDSYLYCCRNAWDSQRSFVLCIGNGRIFILYLLIISTVTFLFLGSLTVTHGVGLDIFRLELQYRPVFLT
jgi:hypothetical protein